MTRGERATQARAGPPGADAPGTWLPGPRAARSGQQRGPDDAALAGRIGIGGPSRKAPSWPLAFLPAAVAVLGTVLPAARARAGNWPMWRHDAGRTAASPDGLPDDLRLLWTRKYPPREPVWDDPLNRDLMPYDSVFEPVVAGKRMFVPFNDRDKLVCLDADTGTELWTFHADGPVRLPPVASRGNVYLSSDDGRLYCLRADSGELAWRHDGAPTARKVLGNKRVISSWPARGGPVVSDGVVYYAASIWPFMGTFIYALDAGTGRVRWLNDSTGAQYIKQPHRAPAFAGVAPQGAFVVAGSRLLVPGGRSVPACFDLETGDQIYYRLAENQKTGGAFVCALGRLFFNHYRERVVNMYDLETGDMLAKHVGRYPVLTEGACYFSGDSVRALDAEALARDPKKPDAAELWRVECDASGDLIRAGDRLYAAGGAGITAIDVTDGGRRARIAWTKKAGSEVGRLLAADGKLFAVTLDGKILAFGSGRPRPGGTARPGRDNGVARTARPGRDNGVARTTRPGRDNGVARTTRRQIGGPSAADVRRARRILDETGVTEGYALVWGARSPGFLEALAAASRLHIVAVCADARTVDAARRHLDGRGLYGRRVAVHQGDPVSFMAPPYIASLSVVVSVARTDTRAAGGGLGEALERAYRSVRPYGGAVWCEDRNAARSAARLAREGRLPGATRLDRPGATLLRRKGPLAGSAAWTHQYGDCANTVKSDDALVKLPLGLVWFGGCSNMDVLPRHGHGPPEQVIGGRLFIEGIDLLSARDVYTGRVLWKSEFDDLGNFGVYYDRTHTDTPTSTSYNQVHLPGANARGANFVATEDKVYVAHGGSCRVLDAATGETVRDMPLPRAAKADGAARWAYVGVYGGILLGGTGFVPFSLTAPFKVDKPSPWTDFDRSASRGLVAMDRHSGDVRWQLAARHGFLHNGIAAGAGKVFCLDKVPPFVEANLRRRGQDAQAGARLIALDAATGRALWTKERVFGTWLGYSEEHDVLLQAGRPSRDMVKGEGVGRMAGLRGRDGRTLWEERGEYGGPPIIHGDRIVTAGRMFSLLTGERVTRHDPFTGEETDWVYKRTYGCNYNIGAEHLLTFRSGAAGFYDLATDGGTGNFGGFKSGCTSNLVAADGVLNAPDYTRTCSCSYQNQTSLALVHDPDVEVWTTFASKPAGGRIRRVGINLGAPGDRRAGEGTYWIEYPLVGGRSPEVAVQVKGDDVGYFRHHSARMSGEGLRWVAASGVRGAAKIEVTLGEPGGAAAGGYACRTGADDAEESAAGDVSLGSSDLELVEEKSRQTVGMRFAGIALDRGARLTQAYVQFQVDEKSTAPAELLVSAEASDDAAAFRARKRDISSRRRTAKSVTWRPEPWGEEGARGPGQRTPDISTVVGEVIGRPGWRRGNAIVLIITGKGKRVAEAFDGDPGGAPRLVVRTEREDRERLRARGAEPPSRYTVRLHFAEPEDAAAGERVFDVSIQGEKRLRSYDIVREAGGVRRPVVRTFRGVGVRDVLEISLEPSRAGRVVRSASSSRPGAGRPPVLGGIELVAE